MITQEEAQEIVDEIDAIQSTLQRLKLKVETAAMSRLDASGIVANRIIRAVCDVYKITRAQLLERSRVTIFVDARRTAAHLMRHYGGLSCMGSAEMLRCDHTLVVHGCKRAEELLETDPIFIQKYMEAERILKDQDQSVEALKKEDAA